MTRAPFNQIRSVTSILAALAICVNTAWSQEELNDDREIKEHPEVRQSMTEPVYRRLGTVHTLIGENDYAKALENLEKLAKVPMNQHEEALVQQTFGFIYIQLDRPQDALAAFEKSLDLGMMPGSVIQGLRYSVAGLYLSEGQHQKAIDTMRLWFQYEEDPKADAYMVIASAYGEMEQMENALPYVQKAISMAEKPVRGTGTCSNSQSTSRPNDTVMPPMYFAAWSPSGRIDHDSGTCSRASTWNSAAIASHSIR